MVLEGADGARGLIKRLEKIGLDVPREEYQDRNIPDGVCERGTEGESESGLARRRCKVVDKLV